MRYWKRECEVHIPTLADKWNKVKIYVLSNLCTFFEISVECGHDITQAKCDNTTYYLQKRSINLSSNRNTCLDINAPRQ